MANLGPLTKDEQEEIDTRIAKMYRAPYQTETHGTLAAAIFRYKATVKDRDERIAALETELAASRIDAIGSDDLASYEHGAAIEAEERVAALEAELESYRCARAYWEDSARYESAMRAKAEAEVARLTPLAATGEAVNNLPPGFFIGNGLYGSDEWVVICEDEDDGHLFPHINAQNAASAVSLASALAALRGAKGEG